DESWGEVLLRPVGYSSEPNQSGHPVGSSEEGVTIATRLRQLPSGFLFSLRGWANAHLDYNSIASVAQADRPRRSRRYHAARGGRESKGVKVREAVSFLPAGHGQAHAWQSTSS